MSIIPGPRTAPISNFNGSKPERAPITDAAWDMLWNVAAVDAESAGCAEHQDPACLCDVDVSLTADVEWERGPMDLVEVETVSDLITDAAAMLISRDLSARLNESRFISNEHYDYSNAAIARCMVRDGAIVHWILAHPYDSSRDVAEQFDNVVTHEDINYLRKILGCTVVGGPIQANLKRIMAWYLAGDEVADITARLRAEGYEVEHHSVYYALRRAGLLRKKNQAA